MPATLDRPLTLRPPKMEGPGLLPGLARQLQENFFWLLLLTYALAAVAPGMGLWLVGASLGEAPLGTGPTRVSLPMLMLAALLWNAGLDLDLSRLRRLAHRPTLLLAGLLANLLVPLQFLACLIFVLRLGGAPAGSEAVLVGLALIAAMPIAGSATAWSQKADGDASLSLGLVLSSTLLSPWTTPLVLLAVSLLADGQVADRLRAVSGQDTGTFLFLCVLVPSALGALTRWLAGAERLARAKPGLKVFGALNLLLLIYANASASLPDVLAQPDAGMLGALLGVAVGFCVVAFAAGWLVARLLRADRAQQTALVFGLGMSNNGTGLVLASLTLAGQPQVLLTIVCYNLVQHLVAGAVDFARARQVLAPESAPPPIPRLGWDRLRSAVRPFASFGFTLTVGVLLVSACASYANVRALAATNRWVVHTHQVLVEVQGTLSLLTDAETGQRGYLLTGEDAYLAPYHAAVAAIPDKLRRLQELTNDNPDQQNHFPELEALISAKLDELAQAIAAYREHGAGRALQIVKTGHGKKRMDRVRTILANMEEVEQHMLEKRMAEADHGRGRALGTVVVVSVVVLVFHLLRGVPSSDDKVTRPF